MLGLEEVEPLPVPSSPAMMQEMPSVKMPLGNSATGLVPSAAVSLPAARVPQRGRYRQGAPALPVDGVHGGSGGSCQPGAGVVVPDGLDDARQRGAEHAQHGCRGHRGQTPLTCPGAERVSGRGHPRPGPPGAAQCHFRAPLGAPQPH